MTDHLESPQADGERQTNFAEWTPAFGIIHERLLLGSVGLWPWPRKASEGEAK